MNSIIDSPVSAQSNLWLIILMPLAGALVNGFFGRRLGRANAALIACGMVAGAFLASLVPYYWVMKGETLHLAGSPWIAVAGPDGRAIVSVGWGLLFDRLSGTLVLVITGVGSLIHLYSASYMEHEDDAGYGRYFTYLNLFVAAMLTLVLGDSLILTFVGWEGVGLCSYLLIGFWFTDQQKAFAGRKAFITNRVGDFGFILGAFAILSLFGTADYDKLQAITHGVSRVVTVPTGPFAGISLGMAMTFACICLFVGCAGKSAQFPLYVWLPDAMAGPTPVSALIHAATMVTAGVYLVARTSFLFALTPEAMAVVTIVGAFTALFAGTIALAQNDIKKVLAYSTVSQLGFMFVGVGCGVWFAGVLHLVTHAFFKACLFLGSGSVMHGMGGETDITKMGGLRAKMPHTARTFLIATLAITGIVPLSGYFSKDAILAGAFASHNAAWPWVGRIAWGMGTLAAFCTAFYMIRLYALAFAGKARTAVAEHAHESPAAMTVPLWILAILSVVALFLGLPKAHALGELGEAFEGFMAPLFAQASHLLAGAEHAEAEGVTWWPFIVSWIVAMAGGSLAWSIYQSGPGAFPARFAAGMPRLYRLVADKFRIDELYEIIVITPVKLVAFYAWKVIDAFLIDKVLVEGTARSAAFIGGVVRYFQNGDVQRYAALVAIAAAIVLATLAGVGGSH